MGLEVIDYVHPPTVLHALREFPYESIVEDEYFVLVLRLNSGKTSKALLVVNLINHSTQQYRHTRDMPSTRV